MLKKAGILVAATTAGLLAVSPLAFAGDRGGSEQQRGGNNEQINQVDEDGDNFQNGLVNLGDVNALNGVNVCPQIPVAAALGNVLGILGGGTAVAGSSADDLSCVNDDSIDQRNR